MLLDLIILALLAGILYAVYRAWRQSQAASGADTGDTPPSVSEARVTDLWPGAIIHLRHVGSDMREEDVQITARHVYQQDNYQWWELEGESGSGKVWLDVEEDDELEIGISLEKLALEDLGLTAEALDGMAASRKGQATYHGETYNFLEAGQATFYRDGNRERGEALRYWDFEAEEDDYDLSVERWEDGNYGVYRMQPLKPSQIQIYSLGERR